MKLLKIGFLPMVVLYLAAFSLRAGGQSVADSKDPSGNVADTPPALQDLTYNRPPESTRLHNYLFDTFGPYPIVGAALAAGINQADNTPPEWKQGAAGYGRRLGSDFGIAAVTTTTRYVLSRVFREDTLYYRCECKGVFPRLNHAVISTFTGRHGDDGHRVFSFPALVAPYAGTKGNASRRKKARSRRQEMPGHKQVRGRL